MKFSVLFLIGFSWIVLLIAGLGSFSTAWLHHGYINLECHPMFAKSDIDCGVLPRLDTEHMIIGGRPFMPYREVVTSEQDILLPSTFCTIGVALLIQVTNRVLVRRRKRRLGVFANVKGFLANDVSVEP